MSTVAAAMRIPVAPANMTVSGLLLLPPGARRLMVLAHGAGAGMRHPFMEGLSQALAGIGLGSLRYQFPYMERGQRRPDSPALLVATVEAAVSAALAAAPHLPLLAGGKSLGGRMTSHAAAESGGGGAFSAVRGLVFFGFPLHPAGRPGCSRGAHLVRVPQPMLFLQGTRDALAEEALIRRVCADLKERATLHIVDGADHGFAVPKRLGMTAPQVIEGMAAVVSAWADRLPPSDR